MLRLLAALIFLFAAPCALFAMGKMPPSQLKGENAYRAPDFTLDMASGGKKSLTQVRAGKKAIIFFWATWCPHCHDELAAMKQELDAMHKKGIQAILVDLGEERAQVSEYLLRQRIDLDSFVDTDNSLQEPYGLVGVPTLYFVDQGGIIRSVAHAFPADYETYFTAQN